jgi:hypothetical protein
MYAFPGPAEHKRRATREVRRALRQRCTSWFGLNLPGTFASGFLAGHYPTAELILTERAEPFEEDKSEDIYGSYVTVLGLVRPWDAWAADSDYFKGLRLTFPDREDDDPHNLVLAARTSDFFESKGLQPHEQTIPGLIHQTSDLERTLARWALSELVRGHERRLADLRDAALSIDAAETAGAAQRLRSVERELSELARSTPFLSGEVRRFCAKKQTFFWDVTEFRQLRPRSDRDRPLFEGIRTYLRDRAHRLERMTADVRTAVITTSNIVNALTNEKIALSNLDLQRRVMWMTGLTIFLAIVAIGVAVLQLIDSHALQR